MSLNSLFVSYLVVRHSKLGKEYWKHSYQDVSGLLKLKGNLFEMLRFDCLNDVI